MLQRNMRDLLSLQTGFHDLLADLRHARRSEDMGRLALVAYCEVRRWARMAGETEVAECSAAMITVSPHASRSDFLEAIDGLILQLERLQPKVDAALSDRDVGRSQPGYARSLASG